MTKKVNNSKMGENRGIFLILMVFMASIQLGCNPTTTDGLPTPTPVPTATPGPTSTPGPTATPFLGFDGSASIPNPPNGAVDIRNIQKLTGWKGLTGAASQCPGGVASSTCNPLNANFNATVMHPADPLTLVGSSGTTGEFQFYQSPGYATAIWGHSVGTYLSARNFIWDFYVYVDSVNFGNAELDLYTSLNNGQRFMMGSQCDRSNNSWDTWNESTQKWIKNTSVPCKSVLPVQKWAHATFYNTVDSSNNTYTYHTLRIDGIDYNLNQEEPTTHVGWPDGLIGVQVQLDADSNGDPVNEYIENMSIYAW